MNRRRKDRLICHTCDTRKKREANPMRYAFNNLKHHATERNITFTISFEYFVRFAKRSHYIEKKGNGAHNLTVDRRNNLLGYTVGNIQPMTREANTRKARKFDAIRLIKGWQGKKTDVSAILNDYSEETDSTKVAFAMRDRIRGQF
jgi:hypothetical protein